MVAGMGEARLAGGDVADGVNAAIARLEPAVHGDAETVMADPRLVEIETVRRRIAPRRKEHVCAPDVLFLAVRLDGDGEMADRMCDARDLYAGADDDAGALQRGEHDADGFG